MSAIVAKDREAKKARKARLERELARTVDVLKGMAAVRKVILFGSLAQWMKGREAGRPADAGEIGRASDIDLIVVMDTDKRFMDRLGEVYAAVVPNVGTDMLVYTPEEFEQLREERAFVRRAVETGMVLYEREGR